MLSFEQLRIIGQEIIIETRLKTLREDPSLEGVYEFTGAAQALLILGLIDSNEYTEYIDEAWDVYLEHLHALHP